MASDHCYHYYQQCHQSVCFHLINSIINCRDSKTKTLHNQDELCTISRETSGRILTNPFATKCIVAKCLPTWQWRITFLVVCRTNWCSDWTLAKLLAKLPFLWGISGNNRTEYSGRELVNWKRQQGLSFWKDRKNITWVPACCQLWVSLAVDEDRRTKWTTL